MHVSVVIPTFNRAETLRKTIAAYLQQTGDHRILEILVVDDGSVDHTQQVILEAQCETIPVKSLWQTNQGLAAARNHAIREAKGDLILFGDDDIIPSPQLTEEHVVWHELHRDESLGVLGYVPWLPEVHPTPFMKWSALYGPQFNFGFFEPGSALGFQFGYFCNTSVRASFLRTNGIFSESFRTYGYEDIELSHRLMKKGYKLLYNPAAVGYHNKFETLEDTLKRVDKLYRSWPEFARTEAGAEFLALWRGGSRSTGRQARTGLRRIVPAVKDLAVPMLRPLLNTYVPLPRWLYEQIFYHYVTSFASIVDATELAAKAS